MQRALAFDNTPALRVPLPFFLNVPVFALLAGLLAAWAGPQAFMARWAPATLALTHLFTLGMLASAMLGAMMQILPVACNVRFAQAVPVARGVHAALTLGTLALAWAFLRQQGGFFVLAAALLALAFAGFLAATAHALWRHRAQVYKGAREILVPVRLALAALGITVTLGLALAAALGGHGPVTDTVGWHALWGLAGWAGLLLMGMSFQLVPIFQVTEIYPRPLTRWLPLLVPVLLLAWSALQASPGLPTLMREAVELLLLGAYVVHALTTLHLLLGRKRPRPEPSTGFWHLGMGCVLLCAPLWIWFSRDGSPRSLLALGICIIVGALWSVVNGMLYKIVPFLLWKHVQDHVVIPEDPSRARAYLRILPKMAQYMPERRAWGQFALHAVMVAAWIGAGAGVPGLALAAGWLLAASALWLALNLALALRTYRRAVRAVSAMAAAGA